MNHKDAPTAEEQESSKETATEAAEEATVTGGKKAANKRRADALLFCAGKKHRGTVFLYPLNGSNGNASFNLTVIFLEIVNLYRRWYNLDFNNEN